MRKVVLTVVILWLCTTPTFAGIDLFGFSVSNLHTTFDGVSSFSAKDWMYSDLDVYRSTPPTGSVFILPTLWGSGSEAFSISMAMSHITATTAYSGGSFSIKDFDGDIIDGSLSGLWTKDGNGGTFSGSLTDVVYTSVVDNTFDGHFGSISMLFSSPMPWQGSIVSMTTDGGWFTEGVPFDIKGGLVDAIVGTAIPVPGALLLAVLGVTGVVGLKSRRFS